MSEARFYLYFASESAARNGADELQRVGYRVEIHPSAAGGEQWLALTHRQVSDAELDDAEKRLSELAARLGGEFDGYERD